MRQAHPEFSVQDLGNFDKYYEAAYKVDTERGIAAQSARAATPFPALWLQVGGLVQQSQAQGGHDKAVLMCGTGQGMAIIANKFPGVYAAVVESVAAAGNAAAINNANVLTLGGMVLKVRLGHPVVVRARLGWERAAWSGAHAQGRTTQTLKAPSQPAARVLCLHLHLRVLLCL